MDKNQTDKAIKDRILKDTNRQKVLLHWPFKVQKTGTFIPELYPVCVARMFDTTIDIVLSMIAGMILRHEIDYIGNIPLEVNQAEFTEELVQRHDGYLNSRRHQTGIKQPLSLVSVGSSVKGKTVTEADILQALGD